MNELQQLRDENAQLKTALTIKNGTIEQLKARVAEIEPLATDRQQQADIQQEPVAWVNPADLIQDGYSHTFAAYSEQYAGFTPLYAKPSALKDRNVTYSTSTQQTPARQVPEGWKPAPIEPSPAMLHTAVSHALMVSLSGDYNWPAYMRDIWRLMLAAAPQAELEAQQATARQVPDAFRVMKPTSAIVRDGDRWEVYSPCGSGGVVSEHEVSSWVVKELLDALAKAHKESTHD